MPNRDDFSAAIKTLLRERVASICSSPECRTFTVGPHTDPKKKVNNGVAAHIHAAASGGPRYDAEMTAEERASASNGIWLCQGCSSLIDRDALKYTAEILRGWKANAEARALHDLGTRVPSPEDGRDQMMMALTRMPISNQPTLIGNAHAAYEAVIEKEDDRFVVKTSFTDGQTVVSLHAKVPVPIRFSVDEPARSQWRQGLADFWKHGDTARLPADGVRVQGSPLFDGTLSPKALAGAEIVFTRDGVDAVAKLAVKHPGSGETFFLDDIRGKLTGGVETFTFYGKACSDVVSLKVRQSMKDATEDGDFTLGADLTRWVDRDISTLPYFERIRQFYKLIVDGWVVDLTVELDGNRILGAKINVPTTNTLIASIHTVLEYTNRARILTAHLGQRVTFQLEPPFSAEDHEDLDAMVGIVQGTSDLTADQVENITTSIVAGPNADNLRYLQESTVPHVMLFTATPPPLDVFGQSVVLPEVRKLFTGVVAQITTDVNIVNEGDSVPVRWATTPDFTLAYSIEPKDTTNDPLKRFKSHTGSVTE